MNKKLLLLGLIVIIGTGFYMNGLLSHDYSIVTSAGTNITVPYKHFDLQSNNSAEVFGTEFGDQFTYVIAFNATENPEMYQKLCNIICQGQRYKDEDTGVVFYQEVSKELTNTHRLYFGEGLALKDSYFNGGIMLNNETGECIICVSTISADVIDILSSVEWGNKTLKSNNAVNTTLIDADTYDTVSESLNEQTTVSDEETNSHDLYESQFNQKDGEPKGETLNEEYIESTGASNGKELQEYMESHVPADMK